jgi:hypothetical protein
MHYIYAIIVVIIIILLFLFKDKLMECCNNWKQKPAVPAAPQATEKKESLESQPTPTVAKKILEKEGYTDNLSWTEVIKSTDLDPSTFENHNDFIKETRRYSSGANFTSTTDDNISGQMVNFVGLRRPSSVPIAPGRRQVEDLQYDVFDRNKEGEIRWGQGVYIRNESGEYN